MLFHDDLNSDRDNGHGAVTLLGIGLKLIGIRDGDVLASFGSEQPEVAEYDCIVGRFRWPGYVHVVRK